VQNVRIDGNSACNRSDAFDQKVAERNTTQARLAIADRIKRRHLETLCLDRLCCLLDQRRDRCRHHGNQGNLDENQRLGGNCG